MTVKEASLIAGGLEANPPGWVVGRDEELGQISAVLDRARHGQGDALIIRGDPGAGKSVLLEVAVDQARGFGVMSSAAVASESALAFGSLLGLLRPQLERLDDLPAAQRRSLRSTLGLELTSTPMDALVCCGLWSVCSPRARRSGRCWSLTTAMVRCCFAPGAVVRRSSHAS
jgi:hypothetical protein